MLETNVEKWDLFRLVWKLQGYVLVWTGRNEADTHTGFLVWPYDEMKPEY